jgi:hypothetical protein
MVVYKGIVLVRGERLKGFGILQIEVVPGMVLVLPSVPENPLSLAICSSFPE